MYRRRQTTLLALLVLATSLAAAGCGRGDTQQVRPASDAQQAQSQGEDGDVQAQGGDGGDGGANGEDGEDGESVTSQGGSSSSQSSSIVQRSGSGSVSSSSTSGPGVKTFSGDGATTLSFNVEEPSRLAWTNSERRSFSARGDRISIDSRSGRGEIPLEPGSYDGVRVRGSSWTIVVRPR